MNERIRELAEQALKSSMVHDGVYRPDGYTNGVSKDFADKFAELLIKECAEICRRQQYYDADEFKRGSNAGSFTCMNAIKRHFGVE